VIRGKFIPMKFSRPDADIFAPDGSDPAQALVYRLHDIAAKQGRTKDQERYNALIGSWSDLLAIAASEKEGLF